jgi:membrane-bound serine protease (ClpP class)
MKNMINSKLMICTVLVALMCLGFVTNNFAQDMPKVFVMEIKAEIDPRMNRYVELALEEATEQEADYVVIEMDTYGGAVTDANDIVTALLNYEKPVYVFVDKDAASAGALISIACDSIYMSTGSSIGAATVVTQEGVAAPDKYQSYMRSTMRSTAEATGRDPRIAEAMVDERIELEGISEAGKVLTFSTTEAIKHGFCEAQVKDIDEIMSRSDVPAYEVYRYELASAEKIIAIFLNPFVSGLLILMIIGGIYFELQTPGVGFPILAALIGLVLYFVPYYLNGLAENWEILTFFIGVVLIGLEVFVIPGFGIAGISGMILTFGALVFSMLNNDVFDFTFVGSDELFTATLVALVGSMGGLGLLFVVGVRLTNTKAFGKIALEDTQDSAMGYSANARNLSLHGKRGVAYTILRPSGKVMIDGEIYDATTRGNPIDKDEPIEVINDESNTIRVKRLES